MEFDAFISHASEDKENFVRELAGRLQDLRISVWYDEFSLKPGNSLRRSIDKGLAKCRYGIIVLSESFFNKQWTNWELDGLVARQSALEEEMLIPIWLNISREQILNYSPPLADKVAIIANIGMDKVVEKITSILKPEGSTLVIARDFVHRAGLNAPVVTNDWWLDVVEYSGQEYLQHQYLSFGIRLDGLNPINRGEYIARHALQMLWQQEAAEQKISQLTHPVEALTFIEAQPGLKQVAIEQPQTVAFYLPQLTILGFGGFLEPLFDRLLNKKTQYDKYDCEDEVALRHPSFGGRQAIQVADIYFAGAGGGIGPSTRRYDHIDWIIWLLSEKSSWLPEDIQSTLFAGLTQWAVWEVSPSNSYSDYNGSLEDSLFEAMYNANSAVAFKVTDEIAAELMARIKHTKKVLDLPEDVGELFYSFIEARVIEIAINKINSRRKIH